ncbi:hypothetical protein AK812_SmicGene45481 [Symbiodinium microadriaticum]|uniref:Uncharacterized protein n=1 Tax=Symbiodinium microadriaticum TaxID=2951 RepID=A0A1Q9BW90_SYMMI|nr:hypothetical protein AK812_SmicGene45481 [Symbiodinium microadriaticum]
MLKLPKRNCTTFRGYVCDYCRRSLSSPGLFRDAAGLGGHPVLGHPLRLALFKRSGPALGRAIDELREDLYNLGSVAQMLPADRAPRQL